MKLNPSAAKRLFRTHGSPLYVYDAAIVRARCKELKKAFPFMRLYYACKANTNVDVVRQIVRAGLDIEVTSPGERAVALKAGAPLSRIAYTCSGAPEKEIVEMIRNKIIVHLDSLHQVEIVGKHFLGSSISVRLARGVGAGHHEHVVTGGPESKFGIHLSHLKDLKRIVEKYNLKITGLHQHIGSGGIFKPPTMLEAVDALLDTACEFPHLEHIDFGGGFGVPYMPGEKRLNLHALGKAMRQRFDAFARRYGRHIDMSFEPGRYLVAEAGTLLVTVTDVKKNPGKTFVLVDSGMGHLIRPAMYGSYHEIENLSHPRNKKEYATVGGLYCESGDVLAKHRALPMPDIGDILAVHNAGAYGYAMSSDYNLRERPKEIMIG